MYGQALPCAGGVGDQPAALMDAFRKLEIWHRAETKAEEGEEE
jgi:hypothetical protein